MPDKCPECSNDLYSPYTYCTSCGWKAKGQQKKVAESRARLERERKRAQKERERRRLEQERRQRMELEEDEEDDEEDEDEWDDDDWDRGSRRRSRPERPEGRDRRREVDMGYSHYRQDYRGEDSDGYDEQDYFSEDPSYDPYRKEYAPERDGGYYHGRYGGDPQRRDEEPATIIPCKCGGEIEVRSSRRPLKIRCPECGRRGILQAEKSTKSRGPPSHAPKPVRGRYRDKPTSGKCSKCGSYSMEFYDDGFGECLSCGHEFEWDRPKGAAKKPTREEDEHSDSWEDRGADRRDDRRAGRRDEWRGDRGVDHREERWGDRRDDRREDRTRGDRRDDRSGGEERCSYCGDTLKWVPEYNRWYCYTCREYE